MEIGRFKFHRRASMALAELPSADQATIRERLESLAGLPPGEWPGARLVAPHADRPIYLLPIDESLQVFVASPPDPDADLEVLDVVRRETLEAFARAQ